MRSCRSYLQNRILTFSLAICLLPATLLADKRADLLALIRNKTITSVEQLRPYYQRELIIPRRLQAKLKNTDAITDLGKKLFSEKRLSLHKDMSCSTCHVSTRGWVDGLTRSVEANRRRSMSLYNLAWDNRFTWSGVAGSLMSQAILALGAKGGMSAHFEVLPSELAQDSTYVKLFNDAFGDDVPAQYKISNDTIAVALEYYVSTITSGVAPFDRWVDGDDKAISEEAQRGFLLFNTKAKCALCHNTWRFSDGEVYDTGLSAEPARSDAGVDKMYSFKAVGLRNIASRPPYMHDGSLPTLIDVIDFYNRGGNIRRRSVADEIIPLALTDPEKKSLIAFLLTLSE